MNSLYAPDSPIDCYLSILRESLSGFSLFPSAFYSYMEASLLDYAAQCAIGTLDDLIAFFGNPELVAYHYYLNVK